MVEHLHGLASASVIGGQGMGHSCQHDLARIPLTCPPDCLVEFLRLSLGWLAYLALEMGEGWILVETDFRLLVAF